MKNSLKEKDFYLVYNDYYNSDFSRELNLLYLPLIGSTAVSIYQYLSSKILNDNNMSTNMFHYDFIDNLTINLKQFLLARKKLEALGLLKTYILEKDGKILYAYKIQKPLSFMEFLEEPLLAATLENTIGAQQFEILATKYTANKVDFANFTNITTKFSDIYSSSELDDYTLENLNSKNIKGPNFDEYYFDFDKLNYLLTSKYLSNLLEDKKTKQNILSLAHLYKVTPVEMANVIEKSVNNYSGASEIDLAKLKENLAQLFIIVKKQEQPTLDKMINKKLIAETYDKERELTPKEQLGKKLDSYNYIQFLEKKYALKLSNVDNDSIIKLQDKYNFTAGVLNVLLDYAIRESKSSGVPGFNYLDKIASSWSTKRLISALDAIEFVNAERDRFTQNKAKRSEKQKSTTPIARNNNSKHIVKTPDYIKKQLEELNNNSKQRVVKQEDDDSHEKYLQFLKEKGIN